MYHADVTRTLVTARPPLGVAACLLPGPWHDGHCARSAPREDDCPANHASPGTARSRPPAGALLPTRPMLMAGGVAALAAAGGGLAVLATLTLIGWITAPHVGLGGGLAGALRSAGLLWLVAHHVEVTVRGVGRIGLLPLGLVLLPAALIERAGRWMTHEGHVTSLLAGRPGGAVDRAALRAVHRRGRGGEPDLGRGPVAVAGGHDGLPHRAARRRVRRGPRPRALAQARRPGAAAAEVGDPRDARRARGARRRAARCSAPRRS